jgi:hypothetical protein
MTTGITINNAKAIAYSLSKGKDNGGISRNALADHLIHAANQMEKQMTEIELLTKALAIYADRDNWAQDACTSVLTGEVRADGWELEEDVTVLLDDYFVWSYDGSAGYDIAQRVLNKIKDK